MPILIEGLGPAFEAEQRIRANQQEHGFRAGAEGERKILRVERGQTLGETLVRVGQNGAAQAQIEIFGGGKFPGGGGRLRAGEQQAEIGESGPAGGLRGGLIFAGVKERIALADDLVENGEKIGVAASGLARQQKSEEGQAKNGDLCVSKSSRLRPGLGAGANGDRG